MLQKPDSYKVGPETVGAVVQIDESFPNSEMEWFTKARGVHFLQRLLVKCVGQTEGAAGKMMMKKKKKKKKKKMPPAPPAAGGEKAIRVAGHAGAASFAMGFYARDAAHSLAQGSNVFSLEGSSGVYLYFAISKKRGPSWWISGNVGEAAGHILATTTVAPGGVVGPSSLIGLEWKLHDGTDWTIDPLLTVTEMSAAELAAAEAETQRSLAIRAVRVSGHAGKQCGKMGVYALDTTHSPKRGMNVYSKKGVSGVHVYHATDGRWFVTASTADMVAGKTSGWIVSNTVSPSPCGIQWKAYDGTAFVLDPLLTVTEST